MTNENRAVASGAESNETPSIPIITTPADLGAMALTYAAANLYIFPVAPRSKKPATLSGFKEATTNADVIAAWWRDVPNRNIGCTPPPEYVVADIDPRGGGVGSMCRLTSEHGLLCDPTWVVRTGGGGWHLWVRLPDGFDVDRMRGKLADGIDLKHGSRGYVLMPPSVTTIPYEWIDGKDLPWN